MKEETFFANKLELICIINSTINRKRQLNCITSAGRLNIPIHKALMHSTLDFFPRPARRQRETNVPLLKRR